MSERMVVHWSVVEHARAVRLSGTERFLVAIWPSPVNPDSCFQAAGFDDFDDSDADWDEAADRQLDRVLAWLGEFGAPRLLSPPLQSDVPWYRR